jgi:hypothetical protein
MAGRFPRSPFLDCDPQITNGMIRGFVSIQSPLYDMLAEEAPHL